MSREIKTEGVVTSFQCSTETSPHPCVSVEVFVRDGPPLVESGSAASPELQKFLDEQEIIGWSNLWWGFVSLSLAIYMDENLPEEANVDSLEWVVCLLWLLQSWVADCWHFWCKHKHRRDKEEASATRQNLLHRIETVYSLQHMVPQSFQHFFGCSSSFFQDKSDSFLENWLILYEKLVLEAAHDPKRQQNITEFFTFLQVE